MVNGNNIKMAQFKGEVLTTLKYLKEGQDKQWERLEKIGDDLDTHVGKSQSKIAVLSKVTGILFAWLSAMTIFVIKIITGR